VSGSQKQEGLQVFQTLSTKTPRRKPNREPITEKTRKNHVMKRQTQNLDQLLKIK